MTVEHAETPVRSRTEWARFLGGFAVLLAMLLVTSGFDATGRWGLAILAAVLVTALAVERVLYGIGPRDALSGLGLGRPGGRALLLACAVGALVQLVYPAVAAVTGAAPVLRPDWVWLLIGIFAFHGVAEELVWRGYAYRRLRAGRSFWRAVLWTMPLVAVAHVPIVVSSGLVVGAAALIVAAVTAVPLAYLFDAGRATVWAPAVVHTAIDGFKLVDVPSFALTTFSLLLAAVTIAVPLLVLAVPPHILLPAPTAAVRRHGLWEAVRWPACALAAAGALSALASALDLGSPADRDVALLIGAPTLWILLPFIAAWFADLPANDFAMAAVTRVRQR